jgi:hypothetical protein
MWVIWPEAFYQEVNDIMTTKEALVDQDFEEFVRRNLPDSLVADTSAHGQGARDSWIGDARRLWLARIELGWRPAEILGDVDPPITNNAGRVQRPPAPTIPQEIEFQVDEILRELSSRALTLDSVQMFVLERAADSQPHKVAAALHEARGLIQRHDSEQAWARGERARMPWMITLVAFRGPGGITYQPGRQQIEPALRDQLAQWAEKVEVLAKDRSFESIGYPTWPVFWIEES